MGLVSLAIICICAYKWVAGTRTEADDVTESLLLKENADLKYELISMRTSICRSRATAWPYVAWRNLRKMVKKTHMK